jgi:hypothetical protein
MMGEMVAAAAAAAALDRSDSLGLRLLPRPPLVMRVRPVGAGHKDGADGRTGLRPGTMIGVRKIIRLARPAPQTHRVKSSDCVPPGSATRAEPAVARSET